MGILSRKIATFLKKVADLPDRPGGTITTAVLKGQFDSSPEELRVAHNGLVDDLASTTAGASGAQQIGSEAIAGLSGTDVFAQIASLKSQVNSASIGQIPDASLVTSKYADGSVTLAKLSPMGTGSGLNADKVDGLDFRINDTLEVNDGTGWKPVGGVKGVQRGVTSMGSATSVDVTISAVNLQKSFISISASMLADLVTTIPKATLTSATNLQITRAVGSSGPTVAWEVIEFY